MRTYSIIGLMSGSSLDGLDMAHCKFTEEGNKWDFEILHTEMLPYPTEWVAQLKKLPSAGAKTFVETDAALGHYIGNAVKNFILRNVLQGKIDAIASHGHTIFHFPEKHFTSQIGDGASIAASTNLPVINNFRVADVALGGQGTPIVPIGDQLLFSEYRFCLNIGGIANISCKTGSKIIAFDICAANQVMNSLANTVGKEYDESGDLAASGQINKLLLDQLNAIAFFSQTYPKSLDNSFAQTEILPLLEKFNLSVEDKLRTFVEHICSQVVKQMEAISSRESLRFSSTEKMLISGGGAFNTYLIYRLKQQTPLLIEIPSKELIKYKEAMVIALMGALRLKGDVNVLKSVTGASRDSVGGVIYHP